MSIPAAEGEIERGVHPAALGAVPVPRFSLSPVHRETNPRYHALLRAFEARTGCGMLVNTSFNVRGEPIVCTPEDAYRCFMGTEMDVLSVAPFLLFAEAQPGFENRAQFVRSFAPD